MVSLASLVYRLYTGHFAMIAAKCCSKHARHATIPKHFLGNDYASSQVPATLCFIKFSLGDTMRKTPRQLHILSLTSCRSCLQMLCILVALQDVFQL